MALWESLVIRLLPRVWEDGFNRIEKLDLVTQALRAAFKNKLIKSTWISFCDSVEGWFKDGISEVRAARDWNLSD